ncbi:uncharacterized protein LOC142548011 [Primulina tabacum]|uniref:uncharacterized protein LOC142548011 n=1 Tax=Primulina tabacum TaxID=48773 RepID=UPI003F5A1455
MFHFVTCVLSSISAGFFQQVFWGSVEMGTLPQSHVADLESAGGGRQVPATSGGGGSLSSNVPGESLVESTDVGSGAVENKLRLGRNLRVCRICHLYTDATNQDSGLLFELGCSCREDLAVAHKQCAEAWFKIKGNKICEICGSIAQNVSGADEAESTQPQNGSSTTAIMPTNITVSRNIWQSHRVLNFLLACMVVAFVVSWLFHFNVRS